MPLGRDKLLSVTLNLLYMGINFSALTLFSLLASEIRNATSVPPSVIQWAAISYSSGIFLAFFAGHSKFSENHPKATVVAAASLAALPQFLIPLTPCFPPYARSSALIGLRLLQGLVMMAVPIFSAQVGNLFRSARPLALGVILSGIFLGGFIGSSVGPALSDSIGWTKTYTLFGILMLGMAVLWVITTPENTLPKHNIQIIEAKRKDRDISVWRDPFTWVWGLTFFPAIWIIFTLAPLINFVVGTQIAGGGAIASRVLEASYMVWSVVIGAIAYAVARSTQQTPRALFRSFASVQAFCFIVSLAGVWLLYLSRDIYSLIIALILMAVIQGTAPTFWSLQLFKYY
jgi:MFS family permease